MNQTEPSTEKILDYLRTKGARITPVVTYIVTYLHQSQSVHSPQEIKEVLNKNLSPNIGFSTIYRILDRLSNAGVLYRMHRNDNQTYFFLCRNPLGPDHHHHFICKTCKKVDEVPCCPAKDFQTQIQNTLKAKITDHIIQLGGLCAECKEK